MTSQSPASWRDCFLTLVEIGRSLERVEACLRRINATSVFDDKAAAATVDEAITSARHLVRQLDSLRYRIGGRQ